MNDMQDRVAVITGGARGIGLATGREIGSRGGIVVLCDIDGAEAEKVAAEFVGEGLRASAFQLDVTNRNECAAMARIVRGRHGPVSILINNAGIAGGARLGDEQSAEQWDRSIAINLTGVYNVTTACLPDLKTTHGTIVNVASIMAFVSGFAQAGYTASKGGVRSLTQAMCRELTPFGIRANAVAPGYVETPMTAPRQHEFKEWLEFHNPMKRFGKPDELAKVIAFLCSDDASFVNGVTLPVDGGYLAI